MKFHFRRPADGYVQRVQCAPGDLYIHGVDYYHKDTTCDAPPPPVILRYDDDVPPPWSLEEELRYELDVAGLSLQGTSMCTRWYLVRIDLGYAYEGAHFQWFVPVGAHDLAWDNQSPGGPGVNWGEQITYPAPPKNYTYDIEAQYVWGE